MTGDGIRPDETITAVRDSIESSPNVPSDVDYLEKEPDLTGDEGNVKLPLVTIQPVSEVRITDFNTDLSDYVLDSNGNRVGRVFTGEYRLDLQIDIWTASGSSHDQRDIGNAVWDALYPHDSKSAGRSFTDSNGSDIQSIWKVRVGDGEPANDLAKTPTLRRWRQSLTLWAFHRFDTTEDYVATVNGPSDDGFSDSDGDGMLEN